MRQAPTADTRERVFGAATSLFASKGFRGTTIRDIATRARVNVASGHYHFGSKKTLYLAVLREQFAAIRQTLVAREGQTTADHLRGLSRRALEERLRTRIQLMLDLQVGANALPHPALVQREMADPTEALPIIVREFITPLMEELSIILAHLAPTASARTIERCCLSIAGQANFYFTARPALLQLWGLRGYPANFTRELAEHITAFSLGGLDRVTRAPRKGRNHAR